MTTALLLLLSLPFAFPFPWPLVLLSLSAGDSAYRTESGVSMPSGTTWFMAEIAASACSALAIHTKAAVSDLALALLDSTLHLVTSPCSLKISRMRSSVTASGNPATKRLSMPPLAASTESPSLLSGSSGQNWSMTCASASGWRRAKTPTAPLSNLQRSANSSSSLHGSTGGSWHSPVAPQHSCATYLFFVSSNCTLKATKESSFSVEPSARTLRCT
mmetsp:Transcript_727/g.2298  ORF Transcript_727/g.2298 Transcript_727/m.2298 type:complete len:217 (-) Transcript_727:386-1036(-)